MPNRYRLCGKLPWIASRLHLQPAHVLICASPEPRTWSAVFQLSELGLVSNAQVLVPSNPFESRFSADFDRLRAARLSEFDHLGVSAERHNFDLISNVMELRGVARSAVELGNTVVIDISTMPKRIFFPLTKFLLQFPADQLRTLVATYTVPMAYPPSSEPLVEDLTQMAPLPTYGPDVVDPVFETGALEAKIVVGLGFEIGTLPEFLSGSYRNPDLKVLFPIPPGPPSIHRNHELMRQLRETLGPTIDVRHVSSLEVSETFDFVASEAQISKPDLAPYGPKPMSLGMCLAAIRHDLPVYYAQPRAYNPRYSLGIDHADPVLVNAYPIRVHGRDWY